MPPAPDGRKRAGLLTAADWRAVQRIWDAVNSQFDDMAAAHKRQMGYAPRKVEAAPLSLSVDGGRVDLPGGYYPVAYDPQADGLTRQRQEKQDILDRTDALFPKPEARRGFAQARAARVARPVLLSTSVLHRHLDDVTRFIELSEIVRFADRVTQAPAFRNEYRRAFGHRAHDAIRPNLKGLVRDEAVASDPLMETAERARLPDLLRPWLEPEVGRHTADRRVFRGARSGRRARGTRPCAGGAASRGDHPRRAGGVALHAIPRGQHGSGSAPCRPIPRPRAPPGDHRHPGHNL